MSRLTLNITMKDAIMAMADEGDGFNPGAMTVCMEFLKNGAAVDPQNAFQSFAFIMDCDTLEIYGSRLYMLWNDVCGRDLAKTCAVLRGWQLGQLAGTTEAAINHAIDNRGEGLDLDAVVAAVCQKLPTFSPLALQPKEEYAQSAMTPTGEN